MPLRKQSKEFKPLWKEWDHNAQKDGQRNTVYFVNGDQYTGEWKDNKKSGITVFKKQVASSPPDGSGDRIFKPEGLEEYSVPPPLPTIASSDDVLSKAPEPSAPPFDYIPSADDFADTGKGTYTWKKKGAIYDGDWLNDKRNGYGTYSLPTSSGGYRKVYSGGWKDDKRQGYGTNFYKDTEYFEGEWHEGKRSGWGRMYYEDGSVYEGEWLNGMRHGNGMLRLANENRYEGSWKEDKKHGDGKFYFLDTGQLYIGTWVEDIPKCGTCEEFGKETATNPSPYPLPECTLEKPKEVLEDARRSALEGHV